MKAVVCQHAELRVAEMPEPTPASGQVRLRVLRCGICGSKLMVGTCENLGRLPIGWWHLWRLGEVLGAAPKHPVIFECAGMPGVIESILNGAPLFSRIVVAGVCVGTDQFTPAMAVNKEIDLRFVFGYTPVEFRDTLHMLAEGKVDPRPLITGTVGLGDVDAAFTALSDPGRHAKILINPQAT